MMAVLEAAARLFYDPYVFWGTPLLLAAALEIAARLRSRTRRRKG